MTSGQPIATKKYHTVRGLFCGPSFRCCCLVMIRFTLQALACLSQSQWRKNINYYCVHGALAIYRHPGIQSCILRVYPVVGFIRYIMMASWHGDVSALLALCEGSPAFVYQFLWVSNKRDIKLLHYCPFVRRIQPVTLSQRTSNVETFSCHDAIMTYRIKPIIGKTRNMHGWRIQVSSIPGAPFCADILCI